MTWITTGREGYVLTMTRQGKIDDLEKRVQKCLSAIEQAGNGHGNAPQTSAAVEAGPFSPMLYLQQPDHSTPPCPPPEPTPMQTPISPPACPTQPSPLRSELGLNQIATQERVYSSDPTIAGSSKRCLGSVELDAAHIQALFDT